MTRLLLVAVLVFVVALAASLYVSFVAVDRLPERVPVHWDINFQPNRYIPREEIWMY